MQHADANSGDRSGTLDYILDMVEQLAAMAETVASALADDLRQAAARQSAPLH